MLKTLMAKQDDYIRYTIRVPAPLYERVARAADLGLRSVNAEIVATLEEKFPAFNVENSSIAEWLAFIDGASDERELKERLRSINQGLAGSRVNNRMRVTANYDQFTGAITGLSLIIDHTPSTDGQDEPA